jgi:DNA-binding IclR family transcriptional regulator
MRENKAPVAVVKSAQRTLQVFEFFAERQTPATVTDVSRALGYPQSSTSMLMMGLHQLGYLSYDRYSRQFLPTLRISIIGALVQDSMYCDSNLMRLMSDLQKRTGETVVLGLQNDIHVQYIHSIQAVSPLRLYVRPGTLRPLARAAVGKMLLSTKPEKEIRALVARINDEEEAPEHRIKLPDLFRDMEQCRNEGYCRSDGSVTAGAGVIAMLVPPAPGHPHMALGVGGPLERVRQKKRDIIAFMQEALYNQQATQKLAS